MASHCYIDRIEQLFDEVPETVDVVAVSPGETLR